MPKLPTDYSKCVIYKITCLDKTIEYIYVGSTTNFTQRKRHHKSNCNNENNKELYNLKLYTTIRENGGWLNWTMVQIEEFSCNNKRESECREEYWRVELNAQLNMKKAFGAETIKETKREWYQENKDKIKKQIDDNKDVIKEYQKQYYIKHKDLFKERNKQYRDNKKLI